MTVCGEPVKGDDLAPIQLVPASQAQSYIKELQSALGTADGQPVFLVDDGATGTSHTLIVEAAGKFHEFGSLEGTKLLELIRRLVDSGNSFRIWWADNAPDAYLRVVDCSTMDEILAAIREQLSRSGDIRVRYGG